MMMRWDKFTPAQDGDHYERVWWHFVEKDFPEWGKFWAHHCVPLTNRIDESIAKNDQAKMFVRADPKISRGVEALLIRNYSVFYFLARSCAIVACEPHLFPEDGFIFLRATTENVSKFLDTFRDRVANRLGINEGEVPQWKDIKNTETAKCILEYRDALVHGVRLGRHPSLTSEFIPRPSHMVRHATSQAKHYWRVLQNLPEEEFVDSRNFLRKLQTDLMKEINPVWKKITHLLDEHRTGEKYLKLYRLEIDAEGDYRPITWSPKTV
jgi:hypothetical protein